MIMEHLTNFEIFLCGVCVAVFIFGMRKFWSEVFLGEFKNKSNTAGV